MTTTIPSFQVRPLPGPFGAEIHGLDLEQDVSIDLARAIMAALHRFKVLVFPRQELTEDAYLRFGSLWGDPIHFFRPDMRLNSSPLIITVANAARTPDIERDRTVQWHNDGSYEETPASITMLLCKEAPLVGGETLFSDLQAAHDALPAELRDMIGSLKVWHRLQGAPRMPEEIGMEPLPAVPMANDATPDEALARKFLFPLVKVHPLTGRRALYLSGTANTVDGWEEQLSQDFILALRKHAVQPRFRQQVKAEVGDILMWDNFAVQHSATPIEYSDEDGKRRLLYRISTRGLPVFCREVPEPA